MVSRNLSSLVGNWLSRTLPLLLIFLCCLFLSTSRAVGADITCCQADSAEEQKKSKIPLICIDPGHSKATVGATGHGLKEYAVCWQMAKLLEAELKKAGYRVILTKPDQDANVTNQRRAEIANQAHADLLIRLHCDSGPDSGISTYYPARQGHIRDKTGPSDEIIARSKRSAHLFHAALIEALHSSQKNRDQKGTEQKGADTQLPLQDRGVRTDMQTAVGANLGGALEGSIYSEVPVILVEMAVLDSPADAHLLQSPISRQRLAAALAAGVQATVNR